jgi:hypothetical protein
MYFVPALTAIGVANVSSCHPDAVSFVNVPVPRAVPVAV